MRDIFANHNLYPLEGKIKEHFKDNYDSVFIAFMPFLDARPYMSDSDEAEDIIPNYHYYPTEDEIIKNGQFVSWHYVIKKSGLKDYGDLHIALLTSIIAIKRVFQRPESFEKLENFTVKEKIWHPSVDEFNTSSKLAIYKTFKLFGINEVIVPDYWKRDEPIILNLNLSTMTACEFARKIGHDHWAIHSANKELLFTLNWDTFYFLIATNNENMKKIIAANLFEGFLCNDETEIIWELDKAEFEKGLAIEAEQKRLDELQKIEDLNSKATKDLQQTKNTWWRKILNIR